VSDEAERRAWVLPPRSGLLDDIELAYLDPADEDERELLILAEHPDLQRAIANDEREIRRDGFVMNPHLHIQMHLVVANQLWDDTPPEMWPTAQRLTSAGYERHEVLHMLGSVVSADIYGALRGEPHDDERTREALAALPGDWEERRAGIGEERHANRAERRAARRRR
jgi:hypothetical protein